jgi:hypothetical protein
VIQWPECVTSVCALHTWVHSMHRVLTWPRLYATCVRGWVRTLDSLTRTLEAATVAFRDNTWGDWGSWTLSVRKDHKWIWSDREGFRLCYSKILKVVLPKGKPNGMTALSLSKPPGIRVFTDI